MRVSPIITRSQHWMENTLLTEMLLTGGVRTATGVSGSACFSWLWRSPSFL